MLMTTLADLLSTSVLFVLFTIVSLKRSASTVSLFTTKLKLKHTSNAPTSNVADVTVGTKKLEFPEFAIGSTLN